jgi:hypothetical protein
VLVIEKVWIMTALQFGFFCFFALNAFWAFCTDLFVLFGIMVFVGLMGGSSYVNVIFQIRQSKKLDATEKELALNMLAVFDDIGILMASLTSLAMISYVFKKPE